MPLHWACPPWRRWSTLRSLSLQCHSLQDEKEGTQIAHFTFTDNSLKQIRGLAVFIVSVRSQTSALQLTCPNLVTTKVHCFEVYQRKTRPLPPVCTTTVNHGCVLHIPRRCETSLSETSGQQLQKVHRLHDFHGGFSCTALTSMTSMGCFLTAVPQTLIKFVALK